MTALRHELLGRLLFRSLQHKLPFLATMLLASTLSAQTGTSSTVASELQQGEQALKANDQSAAAKFFQSALAHDPANAEAHANLGAIAFFHHDCDAAEPDLRAALQSSPGLAKVQALLSICELRRGETSAVSDMNAAFEKLDDPKLRLQIGMQLANIYYQHGDFEKTAMILHSLLETDPDNVDVLFFAQRVYSELADNTLNKLAVLSPNSARMEQLIAERLINAGDLNDAIQHYRKALQLSSKLPGLHYELAEALLQGSPHNAEIQKEALTELHAEADAEGDTANIETQLGRIAMLQSDPTQALAHYQRAIGMNPSDVQAEMGLAEVYSQQDNPGQAAKYLRMAVKTEPFNAEAHYQLAQVDRQLHLADEQKKELQLFLDIRSTQDKIKVLYREMNPQTAGPVAASPPH